MEQDERKKKEAIELSLKRKEKEDKNLLTKQKNEIWTDKDFLEDNMKEDGRPKPKYEILYKQNVTTEDIYLGLSEKDPSSNSCDQLIMKIYFI